MSEINMDLRRKISKLVSQAYRNAHLRNKENVNDKRLIIIKQSTDYIISSVQSPDRQKELIQMMLNKFAYYKDNEVLEFGKQLLKTIPQKVDEFIVEYFNVNNNMKLKA